VHIADSFVVRAPLETVWQFLFDVERMSRCVPGVEAVEAVDDRTYRGKLRVKVGPISAAFGGTVTLTEVDAPRRVVASVEADDKASASMVRATFSATLAAVEGGTQVAYQMDVNLRGRLAQFGAAVIGGTARKMTADFAEQVRAQLEH
jgi:carbon monoxide dehydrogenase subunit G